MPYCPYLSHSAPVSQPAPGPGCLYMTGTPPPSPRPLPRYECRQPGPGTAAAAAGAGSTTGDSRLGHRGLQQPLHLVRGVVAVHQYAVCGLSDRDHAMCRTPPHPRCQAEWSRCVERWYCAAGITRVRRVGSSLCKVRHTGQVGWWERGCGTGRQG